MSTSDQLRKNVSQHSPKNTPSKGDDKKIAEVMARLVEHLNERFKLHILACYLPYVCFGWGVDFADGSSIRDRIITMNEFYPLNRVFVHKRESYSPVSMFFREREWEKEELFEVMKEISEASITTYIY